MLISNALASGMFPAATARRELADYSGLSRLILTTLRVAILVNLCVGALLVVCRHDVVRVALQRGAFTASDSSAVAKLMLIFVGSIVGLALTAVATRGLFAIGRYRLVAALSVFSFGLYLVLAAILRGDYGREGLALAFLVSALCGGAGAVIFLVREFSVPLKRFATDAMLKPALLGCVFAGGAFIGAKLVPLDNSSLLVSATRVILSAGCGIVALGGAVLVFRTEDYHLTVRTVSRLRRPRAPRVVS
jgi:putative peptidoglycan lipid II flippase